MDLSWLTARPIAHRGRHDVALGIVENTLEAAGAAMVRGHSIECDVLLSADGEAMVFHDDRLDRLTTASGRVEERTAAELGALDLRGTSGRIPTLPALLDTIAGRVGLVIEIKSAFPRVPDERLVGRVAALLAGYRGPVATKSFDPEVVVAAHRLMPGIAHGIVADRMGDRAACLRFSAPERFALAHLLHAPRSRPDFVSWSVDDLPALAPWAARRFFNLPVITWTVRSPEQADYARRHADQIVYEGFEA